MAGGKKPDKKGKSEPKASSSETFGIEYYRAKYKEYTKKNASKKLKEDILKEIDQQDDGKLLPGLFKVRTKLQDLKDELSITKLDGLEGRSATWNQCIVTMEKLIKDHPESLVAKALYLGLMIDYVAEKKDYVKALQVVGSFNPEKDKPLLRKDLTDPLEELLDPASQLEYEQVGPKETAEDRVRHLRIVALRTLQKLKDDAEKLAADSNNLAALAASAQPDAVKVSAWAHSCM